MAIVAIDVGGTKIWAAVLDSRLNISLERREATPQDKDQLISLIVEVISDLIKRAPQPIKAVGIAFAGLIDFRSGLIVKAPNLPISGISLREILAQKFKLPVAVDNDANLAAWGEKAVGVAKERKDFIGLTLGTGIGGGIIINGQIYRGYLGTAAEIGHMVVEIGGPKCNCGRHGCLESLASGTAIARMANEEIFSKPNSPLSKAVIKTDKITGELVAGLARQGNQQAKKIFQRMGRVLGVALGSLINIFSPELIVLGGGMAKSADLFLSYTKEATLETAIDPRANKIELVVSKLGNRAGLLGAASLAESLM
jgi:glucokinase